MCLFMIMDLNFRSWINKWKEPFQIIFSSLFSRKRDYRLIFLAFKIQSEF